MKSFPIVFLLAVAAGEALDEICNSRKTPTKLIARRTWPGQTATTTAKPTTNTTTASPKSTTTAESSTVSTTAPTTTTTTAGTSTTGIPSTTTTKSSITMSSTSTTTMATTTTPFLPIFTCAVDNPACGNMCGDATSATTGVVQSPNFPGDYGNYYQRFCRITITAPAGWMIQLNFTTFNVETDAAYVQVGEMSITGNEIPALVPVESETMYIDFRYAASSKPTSAVFNWQATFSVTSDRSSCSVGNPASACENMCTNATSAGSGVVQSSNFPGDYGKTYYGCSATIIVPIGKRIQLTFTTFNLETSAAGLFVTDKSTVYLDSVSGNTIPAAITTSSNVMYMSFTSYGSDKPKNAIYNWQATYTAV